MKNTFPSISRRKAYFQNLAGEIDVKICSSAGDEIHSDADALECQSLRGLFIDRLTLRAISLKIKMLLTLMSKAYILWLNSPVVRGLLSFSPELESWIRKNPWKPEDTMIFRVDLIPFISGEYLQPSIKFMDIRCDRIPGDFASARSLAERNLKLWRSFQLDISEFSYLDSLHFLLQCILQAAGNMHLTSPTICIFEDINADSGIDSIIQYLRDHGISARRYHRPPAHEDGSFDLLINMAGIKSLALAGGEQGQSPCSTNWDKGRVINSGAHPVFGRGIFELLTDDKYQYALGYPPMETLKRMIPWTRIVRDEMSTSAIGESIHLLDYISRSRRYLVIRKNFADAADEMVYGESCTQSEWDQSIMKAVAAPNGFVVQENIELPSITLPFSINRTIIQKRKGFYLTLTFNERGDIGGIGAKLVSDEGAHAENAPMGDASVFIVKERLSTE